MPRPQQAADRETYREADGELETEGGRAISSSQAEEGRGTEEARKGEAERTHDDQARESPGLRR